MDFPRYPIVRDTWLKKMKPLNFLEMPGEMEKITRETEKDLFDFYEVKMADVVDLIKIIAFMRYVANRLNINMLFFQSELAELDPVFKIGLPEKYGGEPEPRLRVVK